jgi:hypothetical protein
MGPRSLTETQSCLAATWALNGELVGMLTIEDIGQAGLLGPLPRKTGPIATTVEKGDTRR